MNTYSTTQATNIATLVGVVGFILNYFKIEVGPEDITMIISSLLTVGGIVYNWIHRYNKGDITLGGFKK